LGINVSESLAWIVSGKTLAGRFDGIFHGGGCLREYLRRSCLSLVATQRW
jgi:hypothetical protein